ncbi:TetR family transcriptional regulator [Halospina denitrificans]|uniref:TetR family transcriptional regulator n=1 Tax=Halospina denitrificans TaxID=332522 RepID=A0A4R7JQA2_9GAMM|nr:TetR/AcrR family transcriptional regulator [Halospina denitrificans]TDT40310.1 TetR family transcriptional regulator [Halospina denitrificans]
MKTRDRILQTSLQLFNEQGERNVTTNHIAAELGISPGNLYYHFRNKTDIIYSLFIQYRALVDRYLRVPRDRTLTIEDQMFYLESVFDGLWYYRFFHRDLEYLLTTDERLRMDYREFTFQCLTEVRAVLQGLEDAGILHPHSDQEQEAMALNVWLVVTNWMAFLKTARADGGNDATSQQELKQGIYQVLTLQLPYLTDSYYDQMAAIRERYRPQLSRVQPEAEGS